MKTLLEKLVQLNISVEVNGDELDIYDTDNLLTPELLVELSANKQYLLSLLKKVNTGYRYSAIPNAGKKESYKLSSAQKRLHFLYEFDRDSLAYNMPQTLILKGDLDKEKLQNAFKDLIKRHESLRTSFELLNEEPVQVIHERVDFKIVDLSATKETALSAINSFIQPFSLKQAPLLHVGLAKLSAQEHLLIIDMHHIITDGVSEGILINDFVQLYQGMSLPALRLQYKDYSEWQQNESQQAEIIRHKDFWLQSFADQPPIPEFPTDFPRPVIKNYAGSELRFSLTREESIKLRSISENGDATMFIVILSAFNILLSKLSNQEDLVIGTPVAGRTHADLENIVGMFVNTLALRNFPLGDMSYSQFLSAVKASTLSCFEHQEFPYEELINVLQVERDPGRNPLFDVMFAYENFETSALDISGLSIDLHVNESSTLAKFDLMLLAAEAGGHFHFTFRYATGLFKKETIGQFILYFKRVLSQVIDNIDIKLSDIGILSETEIQALFQTLANIESDYPRNSTITSLFEGQAGSWPDKVAIELAEQQMTYRELNEKSNQLAWRLRKEGVGRNTIVGLLTDRSQDTIVGMLAILKAGGAYMPIDVDYPTERKEYMIADSGISLLVTTETTFAHDRPGIKTLYFSDTETLSFRTDNPARINEPEDLCYIIYTSGTTGNPKGVMIEHMNVVRLLYNADFQFHFTADDVWTMFHSHCFDFSVWEMYGALLYGGKVIIIPKGVAQDSALFRQLLLEKGVTVLNQTPSAFHNLIQTDQESKGELAQLRYIIFGGEALKPAELRPWKNRYPNCQLINMFGITETTVHSTYKEIGDYEIDNNISNIGKPIPTLCIYVLDKYLKPLPPGVVGELFVGGDGVGRGYLKRPELTSARFMMDPFRPGKRLYRSGDRARIMSSGDLEYLGRIDEQVKLRGFRIELGEIENKLIGHPLVHKAVVLLVEKAGNKYLAAYYVSDQELSAGELRDHLSGHLPDYMIPTRFVHITSIPLTTSGKINRKALPDADPKGNDQYIAPSNAIEQELAKIWSDVLGLDPSMISVNSSFFELGGHSLKAGNLVNRIGKVFGVSVPLKELFNNQTISSLSKYIGVAKKSSYDAILPAPVKDHYPLSGSQRWLYFMFELDRDSLVYNMPTALKITGAVDKKRLQRTFQKLIQRHESLRTSFELLDGEVVQRVRPEVHFEIGYAKATKETADRLLKSHVQPFLLNQAPLVRATLIKTDEEEHMFFIDIHHIISDGVSQSILINDFVAIYHGESLPAVPLQYKDYAAWQQGEGRKQVLADQRSFWLNEFSVLPELLQLPLDYERPLIQTHEGETIYFSLGPEETRQLKSVSSREGCTLFMAILSLYNILLSKLSNQEDIVIGTPVAGRNHADLENIVGIFINTLALRNFPKGDMLYRDFLKSVRDNTLAAMENQQLPLEELVEILNLERSLSRHPLFDAMFTFQNFENPELKMDGLSIESDGSEIIDVAKFDLALAAIESQEQLYFTLTYTTDLFKRETVQRFVTYFQRILSIISKNEPVKLADIEVQSDEEVQELFQPLDNTHVDYPVSDTIISLFEEQVRRRPDKAAIELDGEPMTYRELNERSNQLAWRLRREGVGRDTIVGLLTSRSEETIVGMLAILKAGGAYLPIDVDYPADRKEYMITDSGISLLITTEPEADYDHLGVQTIYLSDAATLLYSTENPNNIHHPEDLCYIIYTSGTTGKPKGAMIEHRNVVRLLFNARFQFDFTEKDVWTMFHSHCFDFSVWEMYGALLYGGKVIIIPKGVAQDPVLYRELLLEKGVTVLNQTPSAFYNLIQADLEAPGKLQQLRYVIFGGEALKPIKLRPWKDKYPDCRLINMFGITETTVHVTYKEIGDYEIDHNISNIGKPIPTLCVYVLDKHLKPVPPGVVGELFVGGDGVCRGYLKRPELTGERFIADPYKGGKRLYRSGDRGRIMSSGDLEYLGRIDEQVKIRGFRIEPGEIEGQLLQQAEVKDAIVIPAKDKEGHISLRAYLVTAEEIPVTMIRSRLSGVLPEYMIPASFILLDKIPLTSNGKVDRAKLPEPDTDTEQDIAIPEDETEEALVDIWATVLNIKRPGTNSNFFSLGGDSMKAIKLIYTINKTLETKVRIADLFANPTIRGLSVCITKAKSESLADRLQAEEALRAELEQKKQLFLSSGVVNTIENIEDVYPASDIQTGMIFHSLIDPGIYHDQFVHLVRYPRMDTGVLDQALQYMIDKHPMLRTAFYQWQNELMQVVYKRVPPYVQHYDLTEKSPEEQYRHIQQYLAADRKNPFQVSSDHYWRFITFSLSSHTHCVCFIFHHAIIDGWSDATFNTELNNIYLSLLENAAFEPAPLKCTYKDFVIDQLMSAADPEVVAYWKNELSGYKRFAFESGDTTVNETGQRRQQVDILPRVLHEQLANRSREWNVSIKNICFAAYAYTLSVFSYEDDITAGLVVNNRPAVEDGDKMLGCFLSTVPVRIQIPGNSSWNEYVRLVGKKLDNLRKYDRISLARIIDLIQEPPSGKNPITDVKFNYTDFHVYDDLIVQEVQEQESVDNDPIATLANMKDNYLFSFNIDETGGTLTYSVSYTVAFADERHGRHFLSTFRNILERIIHQAGQVMSKQSVLLPEVSNQLIHEWNHTASDYPASETITGLFEQQVAKAPDHTALVFEGQQISYKELDDRANRLGRYLQGKGVKKESMVALMIDRRPEMIIGILGILKAGGTYLPIDIYQPEQRVKQIFKTSQAEFLLTTDTFKDVYASFTTILDIGDVHISDIEDGHISDQVHISDHRKEPFSVPVAADDTGYPIVADDTAYPVTADATAYIIYTSGSTGIPKGVMVSHRSVINLIYAQRQSFGIDPTDRILQFSSISFDASVEQTWLALLTGAALVLVSREVILDKGLFDSYISGQGVTHVHATPSFLEEMVLTSPNDIRRIVAGGEVCKPELVERFHPDYDFYNKYGPSENTVTSTMFGLNREEPWNGAVTIGRPISNTTAYILDKNKELLPEGIKGELYVGGVGLSKGYLRDEALTRDKFMSNPNVPGERIYRTGDLARWMPDGSIDYQGRIDEQVKLRGFRIELGEIESKLSDHPLVSKSVVQLVERAGNKYLAAYYVSEQELDAGGLKGYLSDLLPDYMVPAAYVHLTQLPLTTSGKVNRKALPDAEFGNNDPYVAPSDAIEEALTRIWADLLKLEASSISVNSSFFDLGGHSLKATNLAFRIKKELLAELPLAEVFRWPTISGIAEKIRQGSAVVTQKEEAVVLLSQQAQEEGVVLLSQHTHAEENLFFIHDISGDIQSYIELAGLLTQYNCWGVRSSTLELSGPADIRLADLGANYINKIRTLQPEGPYHIAGWSFGGKIAYEVAYQLEQAGEKVSKLMLIDTNLSTLLPTSLADADTTFSLAADKVMLCELLTIYAVDLENTHTLEELWQKAIKLMSSNQGIVDTIKTWIPEDIRAFIPHLDSLGIAELVMQVNTIRTLINVSLQEVSGKVKARGRYVKASETNVEVESLPKSLKNKITVKEIGGDHFSILKKPQVLALVKALK